LLIIPARGLFKRFNGLIPELTPEGRLWAYGQLGSTLQSWLNPCQ